MQALLLLFVQTLLLLASSCHGSYSYSSHRRLQQPDPSYLLNDIKLFAIVSPPIRPEESENLTERLDKIFDDDGGDSTSRMNYNLFPTDTQVILNNQVQIPLPPPIATCNFLFPVIYNYRASRAREVIRKRNRREAAHHGDSFHVLKLIEGQLKKLGIDGRECVLRAICEFNEKPLYGLNMINRVVSVLMTNRIHNCGPDTDYGKARKTGRRRRKRSVADGCAEAYPKCPFSLINMIQGLELVNSY